MTHFLLFPDPPSSISLSRAAFPAFSLKNGRNAPCIDSSNSGIGKESQRAFRDLRNRRLGINQSAQIDDDWVFPRVHFETRVLFRPDVCCFKYLVRPPLNPVLKQLQRLGKELVAVRFQSLEIDQCRS